MKTKNVTFEYYRVYARIYNRENNSAGEPVLYDLTPVLNCAMGTTAAERKYQVNGENARLQELEIDDVYPNIWKMSFIRIRESFIPRSC